MLRVKGGRFWGVRASFRPGVVNTRFSSPHGLIKENARGSRSVQRRVSIEPAHHASLPIQATPIKKRGDHTQEPF